MLCFMAQTMPGSEIQRGSSDKKPEWASWGSRGDTRLQPVQWHCGSSELPLDNEGVGPHDL